MKETTRLIPPTPDDLTYHIIDPVYNPLITSGTFNAPARQVLGDRIIDECETNARQKKLPVCHHCSPLTASSDRNVLLTRVREDGVPFSPDPLSFDFCPQLLKLYRVKLSAEPLTPEEQVEVDDQTKDPAEKEVQIKLPL